MGSYSISRENDQSPFCIPLTTFNNETVTICDTSSDRLQQWLKNQFSLKDCDNAPPEKDTKPETDVDKLMKLISKFAEPTKNESAETISAGIMPMLNSKMRVDNNAVGDINGKQSQALRLIEQRKKVEELFENQEATQESSLENMIKSAMQNKMNQKVMKLAKEIAKEKTDAADRIKEEKQEILRSISRRMDREKQLVAA